MLKITTKWPSKSEVEKVKKEMEKFAEQEITKQKNVVHQPTQRSPLFKKDELNSNPFVSKREMPMKGDQTLFKK